MRALLTKDNRLAALILDEVERIEYDDPTFKLIDIPSNTNVKEHDYADYVWNGTEFIYTPINMEE